MPYIKLNGVLFDADVAISDYEENFNVLDGPAAGRAKGNGRMIRDVIGTYIGHKITVFNKGDTAAFDAFWDYLKLHSVDDSVMLEAADGQHTITYAAYYTSGIRKLKSVSDHLNHWDEIEINFIPLYPQITP